MNTKPVEMNRETTTALIMFTSEAGDRHLERVSHALALRLMNAGIAVAATAEARDLTYCDRPCLGVSVLHAPHDDVDPVAAALAGVAVEFTRVPSEGTAARYDYRAEFNGTVYLIRREATTHAYPRGATNPRWFTYVGNGEAGVRWPTGTHTLAEAQQQVRRAATAAR